MNMEFRTPRTQETPPLATSTRLTQEFLDLSAVNDSTTRESLQRVIEYARTQLLAHGRNIPATVAMTDRLTGPVMNDLKAQTLTDPAELYAFIADRVTDHIRRLGEMDSAKAA